MKTIICFGEVLWDVLPAGRKLGGAPLNVALRAQSLGNKAKMISGIGKDQIGEELAREIKAHGGSLDHIQVSEAFATSEVLVELDEHGTASYEIRMPCAWDNITLLERDIKAVEAMLQAMGNRHIIYGVQAAHYETVGAALFWVLEQSLGDYFTDEVEDAWVTTYNIIASTMKETAYP